MINRMSTPGQHSSAISQILKQQVALAKTQVQVASGRRIQTPADDPIAATRILGIERAQSQLEQYARNAGMAEQRLGFAEQAFTDMNTLLQRVHVLAVQANSGAMDDASLRTIATEVRTRANELLQIANRQDGNGEYLFAGFSTGTKPFAAAGGNVGYAGDQGTRQLAISATQSIIDGFSGDRVFMQVPQGNGVFRVDIGTHAGTGLVSTSQVTDPAAWNAAGAAAAAVPQAHGYTISFTDPDADGIADTWEVTDAGGTQVATGPYTDGGAIAFHGIQVTIEGIPAAGDTFEVTPAGTEDVFRTIDDLVNALLRGSDTPQQRAQLGNDINRALGQLTTAMDHVVNLRAETGARLSALDAAAIHRDDLDYEFTASLSALRDLDYAEAISRLNQQVAGLQAAQAAYTRIGQMSLFDIL
jgi:flagellar hook-associated protein 3 FlgL